LATKRAKRRVLQAPLCKPVRSPQAIPQHQPEVHLMFQRRSRSPQLFGTRHSCSPQEEEIIGRLHGIDAGRSSSPCKYVLTTRLHHDLLETFPDLKIFYQCGHRGCSTKCSYMRTYEYRWQYNRQHGIQSQTWEARAARGAWGTMRERTTWRS
jgi:hypothetical protein